MGQGARRIIIFPISFGHSLFYISKSDGRRLETTSTPNRMEHLPTVPEQQCNTFRRKVFSPISSRGM
jgi:hypothetical protein